MINLLKASTVMSIYAVSLWVGFVSVLLTVRLDAGRVPTNRRHTGTKRRQRIHIDNLCLRSNRKVSSSKKPTFLKQYSSTALRGIVVPVNASRKNIENLMVFGFTGFNAVNDRSGRSGSVDL